MKVLALSFFVLFLFFSTPIKTTYPVVLMHGVTCDSSEMDPVVKWIHKYIGEDVYVYNMEIGDGYWDSIFNSMYNSVDEFAYKIQSDPILSKAEKINILAHSQGGLIARGYIEMFNDPPVSNFITWSSPHAGVFGTPKYDIEWVDKLLQEMPYIELGQRDVNPAQYWKDPYNYQDYLKKCVFLPYLNNELETKNPKYRDNIISLDHFVIQRSTDDSTVVPGESAWFDFYDENLKVVSYNKTTAYKEDWLGLRTLSESNRLIYQETDCPHGLYPHDECLDNFLKYTMQYLK
ncbi:lysosomal thioesterase ppt2 [Anaeramoeba flamelloides]|uniref:Lysosomal thioesterase ppt2 n=1 Tax=Anaeramoeba flamelloides TaxID=1746091 RepID=A0ABQ8YI32_9EUKA|nr:lysosomal thioesterase ppt2 [Anaeramoeba flamelloides]